MDVEDIADLLNETLRLDRDAITALIAHRVPVNLAMESHPDLVVFGGPGERSKLGLLGVLNTLTQRRGYRLVADYDDTGLITRFYLQQFMPVSGREAS